MDLLRRLACQARKKALDDKCNANQVALAEIADAEKELYTCEVSKALEEAQYACYIANTAFWAARDNYSKNIVKNDDKVVITENAVSKARAAFLTIQNGNAYKAAQNTFCDRNKAIKAALNAATFAYEVKCKAVNAAVNAVNFAWNEVNVPWEDKSKTLDEVGEDKSKTLETAFNAAVDAFETDYMIINAAHKAAYEATKNACTVDCYGAYDVIGEDACDAAGEAACNAAYDAVKLKRKAVSKDACEVVKLTCETVKLTYKAVSVADCEAVCATACEAACKAAYEAVCKAINEAVTLKHSIACEVAYQTSRKSTYDKKHKAHWDAEYKQYQTINYEKVALGPFFKSKAAYEALKLRCKDTSEDTDPFMIACHIAYKALKLESKATSEDA